MKLPALGLLVVLPGVFVFQQNQYEVIYERAEVIQYNTSYVVFAATHNFKYNRSQAATNITLHCRIDFGNEVEVEVQGYKFASNEYRTFPLRFMFNLCDFVSTNELGLAELFQNCGNYTKACPLKQGRYIMCNWAPNSRKFPPNLPQGSYRNDLKFFYRSFEFLFLQSYASIKYPEMTKIPFSHG